MVCPRVVLFADEIGQLGIYRVGTMEAIMLPKDKFFARLSATLLLLVSGAFAADVWPLQFGDTAPVSAEDSAKQQKYWEKLMTFKMWGTDSIFGGHVDAPDVNGSVGSTGIIRLDNGQTSLGGPIYAGDSLISTHGGDSFLSGPIRTKHFLSGANNFKLLSLGSSILALKRSTNFPNFFNKIGLAPGIALAWIYPEKWYLFLSKEIVSISFSIV